MQEMLEAQEECLDVCVASASVGPAPPGETELHRPQMLWKLACHSV